MSNKRNYADQRLSTKAEVDLAKMVQSNPYLNAKQQYQSYHTEVDVAESLTISPAAQKLQQRLA